MLIRQLAVGEVVTVSLDETLHEAAHLMLTHGIGSLLVKADNTLKGIITERDILRACADAIDVDTSPVSEWMTEYPATFDPNMPLEEAATWMAVAGYRHLPVVQAGQTLGMVSIKDILWAITDPVSKYRPQKDHESLVIFG